MLQELSLETPGGGYFLSSDGMRQSRAGFNRDLVIALHKYVTYIYYFSNYVYKLYWTNNYSVQSDTKYFQPLKGTLKYFYLLFVIIYYTSRAKTQMFRNTTSKPPIGKMMTFPRSRRKAGIRKSNITLSVDINIRFEFMPPGSTVCSVGFVWS